MLLGLQQRYAQLMADGRSQRLDRWHEVAATLLAGSGCGVKEHDVELLRNLHNA